MFIGCHGADCITRGLRFYLSDLANILLSIWSDTEDEKRGGASVNITFKHCFCCT